MNVRGLLSVKYPIFSALFRTYPLLLTFKQNTGYLLRRPLLRTAIKWKLFFISHTPCTKGEVHVVLLIFVASIIIFSFLPEKPQLFLSVIWPGIPPCCRHLVISKWSVSWVRREGNYIRAVMDSENWCGQKMEVPVRSKNTWIRSGAGKIGVHGQKVEYL